MTSTPDEYAKAIADAMRAELSRKRKTQAELAAVLKLTPHTVGRRLNGDVPFNVLEIVAAAQWLEVDLDALMPSFASREAATA